MPRAGRREFASEAQAMREVRGPKPQTPTAAEQP